MRPPVGQCRIILAHAPYLRLNGRRVETFPGMLFLVSAPPRLLRAVTKPNAQTQVSQENCQDD
jgi:hypothetical protein